MQQSGGLKNNHHNHSSSTNGGGGGGDRSTQSNNSESPKEQLSQTNLYIRGLAPTTNDKDLLNMCQQYGKIVSTKAILDKNTNMCKGAFWRNLFSFNAKFSFRRKFIFFYEKILVL